MCSTLIIALIINVEQVCGGSDSLSHESELLSVVISAQSIVMKFVHSIMQYDRRDMFEINVNLITEINE